MIFNAGNAKLRRSGGSLRRISLIFGLTLLFALPAFAQTPAVENAENRLIPADFKSDGCSLFPDCDYRDCCEKHDLTYYFGGTSKERWRADRELYKCVKAKKGWHHQIIAPVMWLGVRIGGVSWLPTPFRWGFGRKKDKKPKTIKKPKVENASPQIKNQQTSR